jgi:hypothetical protein
MPVTDGGEWSYSRFGRFIPGVHWISGYNTLFTGLEIDAAANMSRVLLVIPYRLRKILKDNAYNIFSSLKLSNVDLLPTVSY